MAKDKEKSVNPAAAHRKAEKQKALKKGKAAVAAQRTERLAHRNPNRLQSQIDDLKALESSSGQLSEHDKKSLQDLEREIERVHKAKQIVGDKPTFRSRDHHPSDGTRQRPPPRDDKILGKRGRDYTHNIESDSSDTEEDVKSIPLPRDTPPPLPISGRGGPASGATQSTANDQKENTLAPLPSSNMPMARTVYESAPIVRNLRKEAATFLPNSVRRKVALSRGQVNGKYLESEEYDVLEAQGYVPQARTQDDPHEDSRRDQAQAQHVHVEEIEDDNT